MSLNNAPEEPTSGRKRKATVGETTAGIENADAHALVLKYECEGAHLPTQILETTNEFRKSRLQWLKNHNIMQLLMSFLEEADLYQLENAHSEMIGHTSIAGQWSYLCNCDKSKTKYAHWRWQQIDEKDANVLANEIESLYIKSNFHMDGVAEDGGMDIQMRDLPSGKDLLARHLGRKFAKEAIFVRYREREASLLYDFGRTPVSYYEVVKNSPKIDIEMCGFRHHWSEWYDYRANSVDGKNAFVRLSLNDGSGRVWEGFRVLKTSYNTTFFCMKFNMKDLIEDMRWTELENYLNLYDVRDKSEYNKVKTSMEKSLRMTQLTISIGEKLLMATGGMRDYSLDSLYLLEFHSRHYRLPLSNTSENEIGWTPYKSKMKLNSAGDELEIELTCNHSDLPFMKAEDIGKPGAYAHW